MMAKRLAHGCYVGYFWPGHKPNQGVVAGDGGEVGRCGSSSLSRLYHTRLATPFYSHKEISSDKREVAW